MSALVEAMRPETPRMDETDLSQALLKTHILVVDPQLGNADQLPPIERRKEILRNAAYALKQMWDDLDNASLSIVARKTLTLT